MRLSSLSKYLFIYLFIFSNSLLAEDSVDIWKKDNKTKNLNIPAAEKSSEESKLKKIKIEKTLNELKIEITEGIEKEEIQNLFGIYDPEENDLSLNMWSNTDGNEIKKIFKRIDKIELSNTAKNIFKEAILTYSYLPQKNMTEEEFLNLKMNWLIKNKEDDLLEEFLNKNKEFPNKKKIIQYLVDKNIAKANLGEGCKKSEFISKDIKDSYLEKFKIYCLIFNDKKNEAQLVFDILKEQGLSDKFFDDKINFLLGISTETNSKVKDDNLLNFYLSSITTPDFKYEPNAKTDKYIWEYLNAANLVQVEDVSDKEKIKNLEIAANNNSFNKERIFQIYARISFDLNSLINAENLYQSLDGIDSRALIYQKFLLSDNSENKIKLLFLLKDLFKKDDLQNIFTKFLSNTLKEFETKDIPDQYKEIVEKNIISDEEYKLGKIKYDDKILHRSKVVRFYTEPGTPMEKSQKNLMSVHKKIKRNKNYFFSAKDLALIESLEADNFSIPKEIKHKEIAKKYSVPENLLDLISNDEIGLLALKFVEIIGEDEISDLDADSVYFIVHLLNQAKIKKLRNKVLITALPLRS
tara:strand:+ start:1084 stop:2823 length:1740 start_codon:yes stop_codon:yes gene_type:complete